ncbi:type II CAAX endopeptidase family protein [Deinococcus pimensis]|uniref:type II CAAX endopeptidase family protein n=1 Tax=Deinococcus pimensis TaxID=309888 RepID=UPI00048410B5|nr:type II CAAX endopeptidase family protein [Deinococcus pimensis]
MRRVALPVFFVLAFVSSWLTWWPLLTAHLGWRDAAPASLHLFGSLGPAFAAFVVAASLGRDAWRDLTSRLWRWRVGWWPWAFAVLGPVVLLAVGVSVSALLGSGWPSWPELFRVEEYATLGTLAVLAVEIVFYGFGEEVGWRGFALPRLITRFGPLRAAVVLSVPWALWHFPLLLRNETYASMNPAALVGWYVSLLTGSVLMTWLSLRAQGSLLVLAIFHGLLDVAMVNEGVSPWGVQAMGALVTVWGVVAAFALHRAEHVSASTMVKM